MVVGYFASFVNLYPKISRIFLNRRISLSVPYACAHSLKQQQKLSFKPFNSLTTTSITHTYTHTRAHANEKSIRMT